MIEFLIIELRMWVRLWMISRCCRGVGLWIGSSCLRVCTKNGVGIVRNVYRD